MRRTVPFVFFIHLQEYTGKSPGFPCFGAIGTIIGLKIVCLYGD